jgi:hypothetical protein
MAPHPRERPVSSPALTPHLMRLAESTPVPAPVHGDSPAPAPDQVLDIALEALRFEHAHAEASRSRAAGLLTACGVLLALTEVRFCAADKALLSRIAPRASRRSAGWQSRVALTQPPGQDALHRRARRPGGTGAAHRGRSPVRHLTRHAQPHLRCASARRDDEYR